MSQVADTNKVDKSHEDRFLSEPGHLVQDAAVLSLGEPDHPLEHCSFNHFLNFNIKLEAGP